MEYFICVCKPTLQRRSKVQPFLKRNLRHRKRYSLLEDRLSNLPDDILIHILSLLPTKDAAAACALSHRLTGVFRWITTLDFDIDVCLEHSKIQQFASFVDSVLRSFRSPCLTSFRLRILRSKESCPVVVDSAQFNAWNSVPYTCYDVSVINEWIAVPLSISRINDWISVPLSRTGLRDLDLCIWSNGPGDCGQLPPEIFRCATLEVLRLDVNLGLDRVCATSSYHLPNLKLLHLRAYFIPEPDKDVGFLTKLVSGCPLLEDLNVEASWDHGVHCAAIRSTSLRRLGLSLLTLPKDVESINSDLVVIHTPNLEYFQYFDNVAYQYSILEMPSLVKAEIYMEYEIPIQDLVWGQLLRLLGRCSYVQQLSMRTGPFLLCGQDDVEMNERLAKFPNLTRLELDFGHYEIESNELLLALLLNSPVLETFVLISGFHWRYHSRIAREHNRAPEEAEQEFNEITDDVIPPCMRSHLKKIEIHNYLGSRREIRMIQCLLKDALVLEELLVCRDSYDPKKIPYKKEKVKSTLNKLPRASPNCSIRVL